MWFLRTILPRILVALLTGLPIWVGGSIWIYYGVVGLAVMVTLGTIPISVVCIWALDSWDELSRQRKEFELERRERKSMGPEGSCKALIVAQPDWR